MKRLCSVLLLVCFALLTGCAARYSSTVLPHYKSTVTPIPAIGVAGPGASMAFPAFLERGYKVSDFGGDSSRAVEEAKKNEILYLATVDPAGTDRAWWNGQFHFALRVTELPSGLIIWSALGDYGSAWQINQVKATQEAMRDMIGDFARYFPPQN